MKNILLIFVMMTIVTLLESFRTPTKPDILLWSKELKLEKTDFIMVNSLPDNQLASITTGICLNYNYQGTGAIRAYSFMSKHQSVILKNFFDKDNLREVLEHEKGHLDIAEYVTRLLNNRLMYVKDWKTADKLFSDYSIDTVDVYQKLYDAETEHYMNKSEQKRWNEKLKSMLDYSINIKINPQ